MPDYDLSSATLGRVANQNVDMLMIANTVVWQAEEETPPDSIFGGTPVSVSALEGAGSLSWIGSQFLRFPGVDYEIISVGIYAPAASSIIGALGSAGVQLFDHFLTSIEEPANTIPADEIEVTPLIAGWNWFEFPSPVVWTEDEPALIAAYSLDGEYLFNDSYTTDEVVSMQELFTLADGTTRSWYTFEIVSPFKITSARLYGIDIRVREAS